jgi:aminoglycoside 3-N-acetyltransferase
MKEVIEKLAEEWCANGINKNDTVLIHSSLFRTLRRFRQQGIPLEPNDVLVSFQRAVGDEGTIVLPLFLRLKLSLPNLGFNKDVLFDIRTTPSQMGLLTEVARCHSKAIRTGHPINSFVALGYNAVAFKDIVNFSGYGADSPFAILRALNGKIAVLDLFDQNSMTFYHHVEEMENVDYRHHITFQVLYRGFDGEPIERSFGLFVRKLHWNVVTYVEPMGERLWELGFYHGNRPGKGSGLRVISANALYDATADVIRSGKSLGMLYRIENKIQ